MKVKGSVTHSNVLVDVHPMVVIDKIEKDWVKDTFGPNVWISRIVESGRVSAIWPSPTIAAYKEQPLTEDELVVYEAFVTLKQLLRSKVA